jgi:hypothetical protein
MKTKILIKISNVDNRFVGTTLWYKESFIENQSFDSDTKEGLLEIASHELKKVMDTYGTEYIGVHSSDDSFVRCPDSKVKLPIDSFCCKHDNELCFVGGGIYKKNKTDFIDNCRIADRKEGIWNAVVSEQYKGFHHIPGRYLCPSCEKRNSIKKINFNYHYPWELCLIGQFLDYEDIEFRRKAIIKGIDRNVYYSSFCGLCSIEILNQLEIPQDIELIEIDVYRKEN